MLWVVGLCGAWLLRLLTWWLSSSFPWETRRTLSSSIKKARTSSLSFSLIRRMVCFIAGAAEEWVWRRRAQHQQATTSLLSKAERHAMDARWSGFFTAFRGGMHGFVLVEWSVAIASGIITGVALAVEASKACAAATWGGWLLVAMTALQLALHLALRPMRSVLDLSVTLVCDVIGVVGQIAAVLEAEMVADVFTTIGGVLGLAVTVVVGLIQIANSYLAATKRETLKIATRRIRGGDDEGEEGGGRSQESQTQNRRRVPQQPQHAGPMLLVAPEYLLTRNDIRTLAAAMDRSTLKMLVQDICQSRRQQKKAAIKPSHKAVSR